MTTTARNSTPGAAVVRFLGLYSDTALHPGSGSTTGVVDLPVQRERHTGFPIIPASSLKGSLRESAEARWGKGHAAVTALFGPDTGSANLHAGALTLGEAALVAFPVRSTSKVFVWVTCPLVLSRVARLWFQGGTPSFPAVIPATTSNDQALAPTGCDLSTAVVLEDLSFTVASTTANVTDIVTWLADNLMPAGQTTMQEKMKKHTVIVSDENFEHLVRFSTQVMARTKLNDKKTTTGGGGNLWYEETLPRDCLFLAVVRCEKPRGPATDVAQPSDVSDHLAALFTSPGHPYLQIGGNETVGQGWCEVRLV